MTAKNPARITLEQKIRDMLPNERAEMKQNLTGAIGKGAWPQRNEDGTLNTDRLGVELILTMIDYNTEVERLLVMQRDARVDTA